MKTVKELKLQLLEAVKNPPHTAEVPPVVLLLSRKAIRVFPDGKRVALYYAGKINKYVSIPFDDNDTSSNLVGIQEAVTENRRNILHLKRIAEKGTTELMKFDDESEAQVDQPTAVHILHVHGRVNTLNQKRIERMIHKDKVNFDKMAKFAHEANGKKTK